MAWQLAGYAIAAGAAAVAAAIVYGTISLSRSVRRLERAATAASKEAEISLRSCGSLAEEARETLALARHGLEGFASLAEGVRALGEAVQTAAATAVRLTEAYGDALSAPFRPSPDERQSGERPEIADLARKLWFAWRNRQSSGRTPSDARPGPEANAEHSEGE